MLSSQIASYMPQPTGVRPGCSSAGLQGTGQALGGPGDPPGHPPTKWCKLRTSVSAARRAHPLRRRPHSSPPRTKTPGIAHGAPQLSTLGRPSVPKAAGRQLPASHASVPLGQCMWWWRAQPWNWIGQVQILPQSVFLSVNEKNNPLLSEPLPGLNELMDAMA